MIRWIGGLFVKITKKEMRGRGLSPALLICEANHFMWCRKSKISEHPVFSQVSWKPMVFRILENSTNFRETGNALHFPVHRKSNGNQRFPVDTENPLDFRVSSIFACFALAKKLFRTPVSTKEQDTLLTSKCPWWTLVLSFALVLSPARLTRLRSGAH